MPRAPRTSRKASGLRAQPYPQVFRGTELASIREKRRQDRAKKKEKKEEAPKQPKPFSYRTEEELWNDLEKSYVGVISVKPPVWAERQQRWKSPTNEPILRYEDLPKHWNDQEPDLAPE